MTAPIDGAGSAGGARVATSHLLANVALFVRLLRGAGVTVSTGQSLAFVRALELVGLSARERVRHAARSVLVSRKEDLMVFEAIFARFWRAGVGTVAVRAPSTRREPREAPVQGGFTIATYDAFRARTLEREEELVDRRATWSATEVLRRRRFAELTPEELDALRRLLRELPWSASLRAARRLVPSPGRGRADLRRAFRRALRHGGLVMEVPRRAPKLKERPLVFLADISGSMEQCARVVLQFLHATVRSRRDVETFVFGTRLTRLTPALRLRNVDRAIDAAAREVVDWSGGTRIGESLRAFNRRWSRRLLRRGALVVILSDGLDRGDAEDLRREMRWLRDRAWRVIWLNPLAGGTGYRPLAGGMAAAMEFVDDFLPAHDLASLESFAAALRSLSRRRAARRTGAATPGPTHIASRTSSR
jgi:uncharacterized protein